jgi:hypothetical protein
MKSSVPDQIVKTVKLSGLVLALEAGRQIERDAMIAVVMVIEKGMRDATRPIATEELLELPVHVTIVMDPVVFHRIAMKL